jgi:hypothetical protein
MKQINVNSIQTESELIEKNAEKEKSNLLFTINKDLTNCKIILLDNAQKPKKENEETLCNETNEKYIRK